MKLAPAKSYVASLESLDFASPEWFLKTTTLSKRFYEPHECRFRKHVTRNFCSFKTQAVPFGIAQALGIEERFDLFGVSASSGRSTGLHESLGRAGTAN
jgi:hypothetical protein